MIIDKKISVLLSLICLLATVSGCSIIQNEKIKTLNRILKSGNEALLAKQYDKAIEHYDNGLTLRPNEPTFLSNKSVALRMRGTDRYNTSIRITDPKGKTEAIDTAKNDFRNAAALSNESVKQIKNMSALDSFILDSLEDTKLNAFSSRAESMRLLAAIVDKTKANEALEAAHEYIALETNQEKKLKAQLDVGKMLVDTYNGEKAIAEYQHILDANPKQIEALLGMGLALAQSGKTDDFKKAKAYLEQFVNQAPTNHPSIATAKEILNSMPSENSRH